MTMNRYIVALLGFLFAAPASAADSTVSSMTAASALGGTELIYCIQGGADRKCTPAQLSTYIQSLISGDCTVTANVITCTKTNGVTHPSSFTSGGIPYASSSSAISSSAVLGANLPVIGGGAGVAPSTGTRSGNTTAFVTTTGTQTSGDCVKIDASGNHIANGSACGSGGTGTVTSVSAGCGTSTGGSPITTTGTISAAVAIRTVSGTSDTVLAADCGNLVNYTNAGSVAVTLPQAGTTGFATGAFFQVCSQGAGTTTVTPTTSTIGGAVTKTLVAGTAAAPVCTGIVSDGTNYQLVPSGGGAATTDASLLTSGTLAAARGGAGAINGALKGNGSGVVSQAACADLSNATASCSTDATNASNIASGNVPILRTASGATHPGYGSGVWYPTYRGTVSNGGSPSLITAYCSPLQISGNAAVSIQALGIRTTANGTNIQLALYNNAVTTSGARPSTLIGATASINAATFGNLSGSLSGGPFSVNPGFYWGCLQTDNTSLRYPYPGVSGTDALSAYFQGSTTLALSVSVNVVIGISTPTNIGTFGTWPSLSAATFSELISSGPNGPALSIQIQ